ncbi:MAG: amidohydrolase family protein [Balneolaceae bacterium]|nr:amidohydrolase family protein [Balneolaceae bacterium]
MKNFIQLGVLTAAIFALFSTAIIADPIVFKGVNVLTMENEEIQYNSVVMIENGEIAWIGSADDAEIPEGSVVHEKSGYYLMPGLAEMHAHIPSGNQGREVLENTLALYLSYGITTIRGMLGHPVHLELSDQAAAGELYSPRIFTSGPSFNGNTATDPETTRQMVRDQAEAGYDLLKLHPGITLENFNAMADEATSIGIEFSGHISYGVGLERSLEAGQGTIDHLDRYMEFLAGDAADRDDPPIIYFGYDLTPYVDEDRIDEAARITKEAGVWNVPTNTLLDNIFNPSLSVFEMREWPGMEYIPSNTLDNWVNFVNNIRANENYDATQAERFLEIRKKLTYALHKHGAGLMLGADAPQIFNPPGFSTHRELQLLVEAGLSTFEALKTGTVNVGIYLNEEEKTGKIAPGFRADMILLSGNPLEAVPFQDKIEGVIYNGTYADRDEINTYLDRVKSAID